MSILEPTAPMPTVERLLQELNPEQRQAAETLYGPVLVLAGAGSGKTKTLTYRIANMMAQGIQAGEIYCATFTNKAAKEMKQRISKAVGEDKARDLFMGTFHSLCVRMLRKHCQLLNYESNFTIYDTGDCLNLIERIYEIHGLTKKYKPGLALHYIDNAKNKLWDPEFCAMHNAETTADQCMSIVYRDYQLLMKEQNAMDFGDLIMNMVVLMRDFEECRNYWQSKFKYVYSDEYQDANHAQFQLLAMLAYPQNNLFVVGDYRQSIYKFRGANVGLILNFENHFFPCTKIVLHKNYRSTQAIVQAGNYLIDKNESNDKDHRDLTANKPGGQKIPIVTCGNEQAEAAFVSYMISKKVKAGAKYKDFAILYRTNDQSANFEQLFIHQMIPYKVIGGTGFYQREEIRDVIAYLRVIHNRKDDGAMTRIMNKPTRGIGNTTEDHLVAYAHKHTVSLYRAMKTCEDIPEIKKGTVTKIKDFMSLLDLIETRKTHDILKFVRFAIEQTGYWNLWANKPTKEAQEKLENINEFLRQVERYKQENPEKTMGEFLQEISLLADFAEGNEDNAVRMLSLHSSKGLEFPCVFIVGCNEGLFPSWRSTEQEDMEEERRLMYVGITRAEIELYLTTTKMRTNFRGGMSAQDPSRFLNELPEEIVQKMELPQKN